MVLDCVVFQNCNATWNYDCEGTMKIEFSYPETGNTEFKVNYFWFSFKFCEILIKDQPLCVLSLLHR